MLEFIQKDNGSLHHWIQIMNNFLRITLFPHFSSIGFNKNLVKTHVLQI